EKLSQLYVQEGELEKEHYCRALRLPNRTHPFVCLVKYFANALMCSTRCIVIYCHVSTTEFDFKPKGHLQIEERLDIIRQRRLAHVSGHRSYYLRGEGASLQFALQNYIMDLLQKRVSLERHECGKLMTYIHSAPTDCPLFDLPGYFMDHAVNLKDLLVRTIWSSTCYRAETDTGREAWGLYRVHHSPEFTKNKKNVKEKYKSCVVILCLFLDMPTQELGPPAFRKYDIEAWMPGRGSFGEISSASNCTDYQSRHLNILYEGNDGNLEYAHTVNATACAVPRTVIS
uniref:serine--tRNA ligase n=1 Tax=Cyprinus carpio TaxID=7962 RepID=A0A8C1ZI64_CYPCA